MIIPTLAGFVAGEKVTGAKLTMHTKTAIEVIYFKPFCSMANTAGTGFANTTTAALNFTTVTEDSDGMADLANNRMIVVTPGIYRLDLAMAWASNATGYRHTHITQNGTFINAATIAAASSAVNTRYCLGRSLRLSAGDILAVGVAQTSGSTLALGTDTGGCVFTAEWISK